MQSFEILAEVAIGIAGFGSIAIVLARDEAAWKSADFFRISALLLSSLGGLFLALLPIGLATAELPPSLIWRCASALLAAYLVFQSVLLLRWRNRYLDRALWLGPALFTVVIVTTAANLLAQLANVTGIGFEPNATCYFFGIVWFLAYACLMLARTFFLRPTEP